MTVAKNANQILVAQKDNYWEVKRAQGEMLGSYARKDHAIEYAREIAQEQEMELVVQRVDGSIEERASYGNDPYTSEDRA